MSVNDEMRERLLASISQGRETYFTSNQSDAITPERSCSFEDDLSHFGVTAEAAKNFSRAQLKVSERHTQIIQTVARKRRLTNRAALEIMIERFVEHGAFARLMEGPDWTIAHARSYPRRASYRDLKIARFPASMLCQTRLAATYGTSMCLCGS